MKFTYVFAAGSMAATLESILLNSNELVIFNFMTLYGIL